MAFLRRGMFGTGISELIMNRCEVVGVRNLADEAGVPCTRTANTQCCDCGIALCERHVETCGICHDVFCSSCLTFHRAEHVKAPKPVRRPRQRKTA